MRSRSRPANCARADDAREDRRSGVFGSDRRRARSNLVEQPRQDQGYGITRRYAKIGDDGRLSPADDLRVGDRVLVTLDIEARRRATYVARRRSVAERARADQSRLQIARSARG